MKFLNIKIYSLSFPILVLLLLVIVPIQSKAQTFYPKKISNQDVDRPDILSELKIKRINKHKKNFQTSEGLKINFVSDKQNIALACLENDTPTPLLVTLDYNWTIKIEDLVKKLNKKLIRKMKRAKKKKKQSIKKQFIAIKEYLNNLQTVCSEVDQTNNAESESDSIENNSSDEANMGNNTVNNYPIPFGNEAEVGEEAKSNNTPVEEDSPEEQDIDNHTETNNNMPTDEGEEEAAESDETTPEEDSPEEPELDDYTETDDLMPIDEEEETGEEAESDEAPPEEDSPEEPELDDYPETNYPLPFDEEEAIEQEMETQCADDPSQPGCEDYEDTECDSESGSTLRERICDFQSTEREPIDPNEPPNYYFDGFWIDA